MVEEYLTLTQAAEYLRVSRMKVWQLVKNGVLPATTSHLDKRLKLVRKSDLDKLNSEPRPSPRNEPAA